MPSPSISSAGQSAHVSRIVGQADYVHRLEEFGLRKGTQLVMFRPGNPCILRMAGNKVCLCGTSCSTCLSRRRARPADQPAAMSTSRQPVSSCVALIGNPNTGKSSLFSVLVGIHQRVGNYPGVTVEKKTGQTEHGGRQYTFVDLPGLYSLAPVRATKWSPWTCSSVVRMT